MRDIDTTMFDERDEMIGAIVDRDEDEHFKNNCTNLCDVCFLIEEGHIDEQGNRLT